MPSFGTLTQGILTPGTRMEQIFRGESREQVHTDILYELRTLLREYLGWVFLCVQRVRLTMFLTHISVQLLCLFFHFTMLVNLRFRVGNVSDVQC